MIQIKSPAEIDLMRKSCKIVADVLKIIGSKVKPGVTTLELDKIAEDYILSMDARPAFKGYGSNKKNLFPSTLCTSIDCEVVHGIPSNRELKEGEIISVDVGVEKDGWYGDGAWSYAVGQISKEKQNLMDVTLESLLKGIEKAVEGNRIQDISAEIQRHVESNGYSVVRDLVGHGIGSKLHEDPSVPNFGQAGTGPQIKNGMTLAIEPMVNMGKWRVKVLQDGWTVITLDKRPSAHFEHTIAVINGKAEILTLS